MWSRALLWTVLAGSPGGARYVFELSGIPVGTIELRLEGTHYSYRSRHLFTRGTHQGALERRADSVLRADGRLEDGTRPESLWLWRPPPLGCVALREEVTNRAVEGCATFADSSEARGTVGPDAFAATYTRGELQRLTVGEARFDRDETSALDTPPDVFGRGFAIDGAERGRLAVTPALTAVTGAGLPPWDAAEAAQLAQRVHDSFTSEEPGDADWRSDDKAKTGGCLAHARRFLAWASASHHTAMLVLGLFAEGHRAFPHAWVRVNRADGTSLDVDPMMLDAVRPQTHLALGVLREGEDGAELGRAYLELAAGQRHVRRIAETR
jgi:hypothetical protein